MFEMSDAYVATATEKAPDFSGVVAVIHMEALELSSGFRCAADRAFPVLLSKKTGVCSRRNTVDGLEVDVVVTVGKPFLEKSRALFGTSFGMLDIFRVPLGFLLRYVRRAANTPSALLLAMLLRFGDAIGAGAGFRAFFAFVGSTQRRSRVEVKLFDWLGRFAGGASAGFHAPSYR